MSPAKPHQDDSASPPPDPSAWRAHRSRHRSQQDSAAHTGGGPFVPPDIADHPMVPAEEPQLITGQAGLEQLVDEFRAVGRFGFDTEFIGENSYGKGSVQDIFPVGNGEAFFKCTTQYYQLPKGRIIHRTDDAVKWGIQPDLAVDMTNDEVADWLEARRDADVLIAAEDADADNPQVTAQDILDDGLDPQLEAALIVLKAEKLAKQDGLAQRGE